MEVEFTDEQKAYLKKNMEYVLAYGLDHDIDDDEIETFWNVFDAIMFHDPPPRYPSSGR